MDFFLLCFVIMIVVAFHIIINSIMNTFYYDSCYYNHVIINSTTARNTFISHVKYIDNHIFDIDYSKFDVIDIDGVKYIYPSSEFTFKNLKIIPHRDVDDNNKIIKIQIKCFY